MLSENDWQKLYNELKSKRPDLYKQAVESADAIAIQFNVSHKCASQIEKALVSLALQAESGGR